MRLREDVDQYSKLKCERDGDDQELDFEKQQYVHTMRFTSIVINLKELTLCGIEGDGVEVGGLSTIAADRNIWSKSIVEASS